MLRQALLTALENQSHASREPNDLYRRKDVLNPIASKLWKRVVRECVLSIKPKVRLYDQSTMPREPPEDG